MASQEAIDRGWSAADVDPAEYVDDAWIAENTAPAREPDQAPQARGLIRGGATRDLLRRIAARTGYPVVEAWSSHNEGQMRGVWGVLCHHTGSAWSAPGDYPTLRVVRDGRSDLQNSLCAFGIGKSGTIYLISEKLSWHAGAGAWNGLTDGNGYLLGIEAESDGVHWAPGTVDCYPRLVAAALLEINQDDKYSTRHASYALPAGRKNDFANFPGGNDAFWAKVYDYMAHPETISIKQQAPVDELEEIMSWYKDRDEYETMMNKVFLEKTPNDRPGIPWAVDMLHGVDVNAGQIPNVVVPLLQQLVDAVAKEQQIDVDKLVADITAGVSQQLLGQVAAVVKSELGADNEAEAEAIVTKIGEVLGRKAA